MRYKTVTINGRDKFKFNRGINSISFDDYIMYDILSLPLMAIAKLYDNSFEPFYDGNYSHNGYSIDVSFSFSDNSSETINFEFYDDNTVKSNFLNRYSSYLTDEINNKENGKPIFAYYRRGNAIFVNPINKKNDDISVSKLFCEREWFPWRESFKEFNYFANLAINAKYGKQDEFSLCHYNNIKNIINEFLNVNYCEDFDFSLEKGKFTYFNNSRNHYIDTEWCDLGITVGMIMQLYLGCLAKKEVGFIGNPCDSTGIVICNYNFGERPSYSDKKWDYYKVFSKYFPKIQFIVC